MTWQLALAVAAALFGAFIVWQVRPAIGPRRSGKARRQALSEARKRVLEAKTPAERARALCDAGDASTLTMSVTSALGYYLRAMRTDPLSPEPVTRTARGLVRRPRTLETVLWRRLGANRWDAEHRPAAVAAVTELARLYGGALRNRSRASALRHALQALGAPSPAKDPDSLAPTAAVPARPGPVRDE